MILVAWLPAGPGWAEGGIPERRRNQFQNEPGYVAIPYVFEVPGLGSGYGFLGGMNNLRGSYTDIGGTIFEGDVSGGAFGLESMHLLPRTLILDVGVALINRTTFPVYSQRGMQSGKDEYTEAELRDMGAVASRLTATFLDRRVEAFLAYYGMRVELAAIRDRDGALITEAGDAAADWVETDILGGRLDLTDDYLDPRRGVRVEPSVWWTPPSGDAANFLYVDLSVTAYLPIGKRSTWAFNYFRSDAHVLEKGETDPERIAAREGLVYGSGSDEYVDNRVAENTYGSATALGGLSRLRSYPEGRYRGAHTQFVGTELRWNVSDDVQPFDWFVAKDIRTAIQVAPFLEIGTVEDHAGDAWSTIRSSYGVGFRIVTASGLIYRLDLAGGDEGFQPCIFFQYPWEL